PRGLPIALPERERDLAATVAVAFQHECRADQRGALAHPADARTRLDVSWKTATRIADGDHDPAILSPQPEFGAVASGVARDVGQCLLGHTVEDQLRL